MKTAKFIPDKELLELSVLGDCCVPYQLTAKVKIKEEAEDILEAIGWYGVELEVEPSKYGLLKSIGPFGG